MKRYITLVKAVFSSNLSARKRKKTGELKKGSYIPQLISTLLILVCFGFNFYVNLDGFHDIGLDVTSMLDYLIPTVSFIILYAFFMSISLSFNVFFLSENEQFLCLPISGIELLAARFALHLFNTFCYGGGLVLVDLIMIPIVLQLGAGAIVASIFVALFVFLIISCTSFIISLIVSHLIDLKSHTAIRTIVVVLLSLLGTGALVCSYIFNPTLSLDSIITAGADIDDLLSMLSSSFESFYQHTMFCNFIGYLPVRAFLSEGGGDLINILYIFLILAVVFFLSAFLGQKLYIRAISNNRGKKRRRRDSSAKMKRSFRSCYRGKTAALIRREFSFWRAHPSVIVTSLVTTIIMAVILVIGGIALSTSILDDVTDPSLSYLAEPFVFLILHIFLLEGLFDPYLSYISVSLEGRSFIVLKTFPIDTKRYVFAKAFPGLLVSLIISLLSSIACSVIGLPYLYMIGLFLSLVAASIFDSLVSLILGIIFARFSYDNPMEMIQKGVGPFVSGIVSLLEPALFIGIDFLFLFYAYDVMYLAGFVGAFIYLGLSIGLFFVADKKMKRLFRSDLNIV